MIFLKKVKKIWESAILGEIRRKAGYRKQETGYRMCRDC